MINGKLSVGDLDIFSMSNFNVDTVSVTCTNSQSGSFDISQTTTVSIKNLHIFECGQIFVKHVSQFILENTTFQGSNGTALVFNLTNKAYIVNCFFINCRGSFYSFLNQSLGGVIMALNSSIWVEDTTFEHIIVLTLVLLFMGRRVTLQHTTAILYTIMLLVKVH